jgi:shikimate kinase
MADRLWTKFTDIDSLIVERAGKNIRQIFEEHGEPYFRDLEGQCLRAILPEEGVLGLGGGSLERPENRHLIKDSTRDHGTKVIYLKCDPAVLLKRIQNDPASAETRPNLTELGGGIDEIKAMLERREPFYREVKTAELDVSNLTPEDALQYIARLM